MRRSAPVRAFVLLIALGIGAAADAPAASNIDPRIGPSVERVVRWLPSAECEPFTNGAESFREYMIDVEIWHRLALFEQDPARKSGFERETVRRIEKGRNRQALETILVSPNAAIALTEMAVLARRCLDHGLDPTPIREAMRSHAPLALAEVARVPVPLKAVYAAYLPGVGITPPMSLDACRSAGMLAMRPREVDLTLADVYYLTHEIYAYTDYGLKGFGALAPGEESYLLRVLPYYSILYLTLGQMDIAAELLICLRAAGMQDTYGYREGLRIILDRQNADGSFGAADPKRAGVPSAYLHVTMNVLSVLLLDRAGPSDQR